MVPPAAAANVNSAVLCASKGSRKSSLMTILAGAEASVISMRPLPTFLSPDHSAKDDEGLGQRSTTTLKPPHIIRLPSKGSALGSIIDARRLSFITLARTLSRCLRDL